MENGTTYEVVSGSSCALYLYVVQGERRPAMNQTDLLLGLYAQVDWLVPLESPDPSYLGLDAFGGGNWQGQSFTAPDAQPGTTWLIENLAVTVTHRSDGTAKRVPIHWKWGVEQGILPAREGIWYLDLPAFDPVSQVSLSATGCTPGDTLTIYTNRIHSRYTHTLEYELGETRGVLAEQVGDSFQWIIPESLLAAMPDLTQDGCNIVCATYDGDTLVGYSFAGFILRAGQAGNIRAQEGWYSLSPRTDNPVLQAWGIYLQNHTAVQGTLDVDKITVAPGATLKETKLLLNGRACEGLVSPVLDTAQPCTVELRLKDSRGYTLSASEVIAPLAYEEPYVTEAEAFRCDNAGNPSDVGNFVYCTGIGVWNPLEGRNQGETEILLCDMDGNLLEQVPYTGTGIYFGDLSAQRSYQVRLRVLDSLGNSGTRSFVIPSQQVAFQIKEGGDGAAFGGTATRSDCLEVHWNNLRVGGKPVEDFPVEQGVTGIWSWEKYRSGRVVCWGSITGSVVCNQSCCGGYTGSTVLSAELPFALSEIPVVQASPVCLGNIPFGLLGWESQNPLLRSPGYRLLAVQSGTVAYRLDLIVWGKVAE